MSVLKEGEVSEALLPDWKKANSNVVNYLWMEPPSTDLLAAWTAESNTQEQPAGICK